MFWTLDLNGTRYVVKAFARKAQGGMWYLYWAGPGKDFGEKPLALSLVSTPQPNSISTTAREGTSFDRSSCLPINRKRKISTDSSDSPESTDLSDSETGWNATRADSFTRHGVNACLGVPLRQIDDSCNRAMGGANVSTQPAAHQGIPAKKRRSEVSSVEIEPMHSVTPPVRRRSDVRFSSSDYQPEPSQPNASGSTTMVNNREERRKQDAIARIENRLERKFAQIFTPWAGDDHDVSRNTLMSILKVIDLMKDSSPQNITRALNRALNEGTGRREDTGGRKPVEKWFKDLEAKLKATKTMSAKGVNTDRHSSWSPNPQPLNHRNLQRTRIEIRQGSSSDPQSTQLDGNRQQLNRNQDLVMLPPTSLSQHKQSHTTLIVRVAPFVKYQPVTLSECMSLQSFYVEVLGVWGIRGESVAEIIVTFTWKDPEDPMRIMVMNSRREACFAHLIKQVDKAPGWEESDKEHILGVEIVLKE